ncbi:MAG: hypothetical protein HQM04_16690 [Magnetococcales bacterium]|nr:hypothetical protein [Magnetococcales bacterium]MBF0116668.1 hypothetical protein [Magnetococcales bacterium]
MFAKLVYNAGSSAANVLSDVVAILTGTTNVANLSAACNQAVSSITATVAAGWSVHDASAGSNAQAIRAPNADSGYKYVVVDTNTAGAIFTKVWESWDNSAHTGTNLAYNSDATAYSQRLDLTNGGTLYIFASARFLMLASSVAAGWGSPTNGGPSGCFERTRACVWDTPAFGFPVSLFINFGYAIAADTGAYAPRKYTSSMATQTGSTASHSLSVAPSTLSGFCTSVSNQKVPDTSGAMWIPFTPISIADFTYMPQWYGEITSSCDIWAIPSSLASNLDVIAKGGVNYMCLQGSTTTKMIVVRAS